MDAVKFNFSLPKLYFTLLNSLTFYHGTISLSEAEVGLVSWEGARLSHRLVSSSLLNSCPCQKASPKGVPFSRIPNKCNPTEDHDLHLNKTQVTLLWILNNLCYEILQQDIHMNMKVVTFTLKREAATPLAVLSAVGTASTHLVK